MVATLKNLTLLDLESTQVTDTGLKHLVALERLTFLNLHDTQVTEAGVKALRKALPRCEIID